MEQGEICVITKEGEPFFELFPLKTREKPRWKRKIKRIKLKGDKTSTEIIREERDVSCYLSRLMYVISNALQNLAS